MSRRELKDIAKTIHRAEGDALAGEQVIVQAREIGKPLVIPGTSSHRLRQTVLRVNVLCVIDRPFLFKEKPMSIKTPP